MSDWLLRFFGAILVAVMLLTLLKKWNGESALLLKLMVGILAAGGCLFAVTPLISYIQALCETEALAGLSEQIGLLLRLLCVAFLTHIGATVCRDCGESSLAYYAELGGKIEILLLSLPLLKEMLEQTVAILSLT